MKHPAARLLGVLLTGVLALLLARTLPLLANRDDFLRLYFGGFVGCTLGKGGAEAERLTAALREAERTLADQFLASRFVAAQTPYSPLTVAVVCLAERARPGLPLPDVATWALAAQTVSWLCALAGAAALTWRRLPPGALPSALAASLMLAWIHVHTNPLVPAPRGLAVLATALALALVLTGRGEGWAHGSVIVAALAHPYQQALILCIAVPATLLLAGTPAAAGGSWRAAVRVAATAAGAVAVAVSVVRAVSPRGMVPVAEMLAHGASTASLNWAANRAAVLRLSLTLGLVVVAVVFRYAGARRAAAAGLLFATSVTLPALYWPGGFYPGELSNRVGGAWVAVVFAVALRGELVPDFDRLSPRMAALTALAVAVAAAPGAAPEVLGLRNAPHYVPWLRPPRVEALPGVEREGLRIIGQEPRR